MKSEKTIQYNKTKTASHLCWFTWLCLYCLTIILLTSDLALSATKTTPDPTDILESYLNKSKNKNTNADSDTNTKLKNTTVLSKPVKIKIDTEPASPLNFAAKNNSSSSKLRTARITSPSNKKKSKKKRDLQDLIRQLNSVQIKKKITPVKAKAVSLKKNSTKTVKKVPYESFTIDNTDSSEDEFDTNEQKGALKAETVKRIKDLINNPESFNNFFELGEIMFDSGRLSDAYIFYERALDSIDKDDAENRSWILFQAANCLRNTDYSKAIEYYKRLLTEFPLCQWSELAKNQIELLSWYLKDDPKGLIKKSHIMIE